MNHHNFPYPPNPSNVPISAAEPSPAFRKEVSKVMGSIVFFFIVYIILLALAVALAAGCVIGGGFLIISVHSILAIVAGVGLMGVGIMVLIFLVKFMFTVTRFDRSGSVEVTEEEQPQLFAFIRQLTSDTQTPFPKKIYLSPEVNACVFYDSSFWSMFLPVKKNLQIGLGLVNAVNLSEFKAVMAHEFGHFSQRSMKLGSFVYQVNRVIFNMLYENKSYGSFLSAWGRISDTLGFFANVTAWIVQGIQSILKEMYGIINKSYMGLSREMEFHADAVAASVSGGNNCVSALQRIELASSGYSTVIRKYEELIKEKKIGKNLYQNHHTVLQQMATNFKLEMQNGLPVVNRNFLDSNNLSRINFKDQWASHPTTGEREAHLDKLQLNVAPDQQSAWVIFADRERLQEELTKMVYREVPIENDAVAVGHGEFREIFLGEENRFTLPEQYNGFYDGRSSTLLDVDAEVKAAVEPLTFYTVFSSENAAVPKKIAALEGDIQLLAAIAQKQVATKSFDFDGDKYDRSQANSIKERLEKELAEQKLLLESLDKKAFRLFYSRAVEKGGQAGGEELKNKFAHYYDLRRQSDDYLKMVNTMLGRLSPIYGDPPQTIDVVNSIMAKLKQSDEPAFKEQLKVWITAGAFEKNAPLKESLEKFIAARYEYFSETVGFFDNELNELNSLVHQSWVEIYNLLFDKFKKLLEEQVANQ